MIAFLYKFVLIPKKCRWTMRPFTCLCILPTPRGPIIIIKSIS